MVFLLGMFLISFASATLDTKKFNPDVSQYGQIEIKDWLGISHKADYRLTDYDASVINVWAEGEYKLYKKTHLFTGVFYKDIIGNRGDLRDVQFYIWNEEYETRYNPIYENQNCKLIYNETSKNQTEVCEQVLISNESYQVDVSGWIPYEKGMNLPESEGRWRLEAKRKANKPIDFILEAHGKTFDEWAWWDSSWEYKRQINLTANAGEFSYLFWVDYDSDMQSDYDDLRFVNNAEDTEFNYTIQTYNTTRAVVRIYSQGETSFWMYYGNPTASSGSSASDTHFNPVAYYYLDETSGSVIDAVGSNDGTNNGVTRGVTGKINNAFDFTKSTEDKVLLPFDLIVDYNQFTVSMWVKIDDTANGHILMNKMSGVNRATVTTSVSTGIWYHIILIRNGNTITMYKNNVLVGSDSGTFSSLGLLLGYPMAGLNWNAQSSTQGSGTQLGSGNWGPYSFEGKIDEVGIWSRALTSTEIEALYNYTAPTYTIGDEQAHNLFTINQISPEDNYNSTSQDVFFECNATDETGVYSLNLTINGSVYETVTGDGTTNLTLSSTETLGEGYWEWYCTANDDTKTINSSTRSLTVDTTPQINVSSPIKDTNYSTSSIWFNATSSLNVDDWVINYDGTNITISDQTGTTLNKLLNIEDGIYNLLIYARNSQTGIWGLNNSVTNFIIDATPPEILIDSPTGESDYLYVGQPLDLNFTATDELANVSECWWNYNGTNNSVACSNGTLVSVPIAQEYGLTSATVYVNDTFGNEGFNSTSWSYKILELNKTFNNETTEGAYEQFYLYLNEGSGVDVQSVVLHYDGQTDSASLFSSGDNLTAMSELLIGAVSADTNNTFYFTVTLTDSTTFNTTSEVQLVRDISIDDCSSNPYPLLYLYLKDEETRSLLSGTIETHIDILNNFDYAQVLNISQEETSVNYIDLCSNVPLNESDFLLNAEIRYSSGNHSAEFYHIQRADLSSYPANISLFDLKTEDTTTFKVLYRNEDLIGVEGAVLQLQRKYIDDGIFEVVEAPLTSSDSTGILHIDTNTNKYQITVVKNGEVLGLFQNLAFICESELTGECILNLYDKLTPPNIVPLVDMQDFSSGLESSIENQTITLTYIIPSGTATSVQVLATQKNTILGESIICNQTVISSAGSIECSYSTTIQDSTIDYKVFKSGELVAQKGFVVQEDLRDDWGAANYILIVVFLLSLVFMALSSPEWIVINAVITVLISGGIWLIRGIGFVEGLGSLMWLIIGAVILISKLSKQEDH